ncbi:hypothetical protein BASA81_003202 [Batrachochytrium salamandrivorans]|nr:hypothetical protein BASA81_003202 [Batrachochytrium salamandrivorans]
MVVVVVVAVGDEMFDKPFAEAAHGVDGNGVEYSTSLSDERFWSKCQPQDRKFALKQANENYIKAPFRQANPIMPGTSFPFSPSNSPALFKFSTLEAQHRDSYGGGSQSRAEVTADHLSSSGNEPEVRYVNPLMALRGTNRNNSVEQVPRSPRSKASTSTRFDNPNGNEDLPPLLVLKEVRFYLELVPERSATPSIPVHLLGELAKTTVGVQEITNQNLFKYFVSKIKDVGEANMERRAALWALGHIGGASEIGFERMQSTEPTIVKIISQVATEASCLSLRGTACYTLGLFSRHRMGAQALNKIGWATLEFRTHPFASIAVPNNHSGVFSFHLPGGRSTHLDVTASLSCSVDAMEENRQDDEFESVESTLLTTPEAWRIYHLISDLSNHIAQKDAHAEISKIKEQTPIVFADVKLYLAVHDLLARFNYELAVRQYVLGLFHTKISFENEQTWQQIDLEPLH